MRPKPATYLVLVIGAMTGCTDENPQGLSCGDQLCGQGQVCCISCNGVGACGAPGLVCSHDGCGLQTGQDGGTVGSDASAANKVESDSGPTINDIMGIPCGGKTCVGAPCCYDCDGRGTCLEGGGACPGYACMEDHLDDCECTRGAYVPVCGTDGKTYDAACGSHCVPQTIDCQGACPCLKFTCGDSECKGGVCYADGAGTPNGLETNTCQELPKACKAMSDPDCSCFTNLDQSSCACKEGPEDHFRISCSMP